MTPKNTIWTPTIRQQALIDALSRPPYPSLAEAARRLKISQDTAKRWHARPDFQAAVEEAAAAYRSGLAAELEQRILDMGMEALDTKRANLKAESEHVRHAESTYILDRILGKTPESLEVRATHDHSFDLSGFSDDEIRSILSRAAASADGDGAPEA